MANRSAVLLRLGYHEAALEDVNLALEAGYPKELKYKLLERKLILFKLLKRVDNIEKLKNEFIEGVNTSNVTEEKKKKMINDIDTDKIDMEVETKELKYNILTQKLETPHPDLPCMTAFAEVKYEESRGRFVVAKR